MDAVTLKGGFYKAINISVDWLESHIVDEKHFATEEEATTYQKEVNAKGDGVHCFVLHMS